MAFCTIEWVLRFEPPDNIKPAPAYDEQPLSPADTPAPAAHPKHLHHKPKPLHHEQPSLKFDDSDGGGVDPPPTHTGLYRCIRATGIGESHLASVDPDCEVGTFMRESTHGCIGLGPSKRSKELHRCVSRQKVTGGRIKWTHSVTTSGCKEGAFQDKLLGYVQAKKTSDGGEWVQLRQCQVKDADLAASHLFTTTDPGCEGHLHNSYLGWILKGGCGEVTDLNVDPTALSNAPSTAPSTRPSNAALLDAEKEEFARTQAAKEQELAADDERLVAKANKLVAHVNSVRKLSPSILVHYHYHQPPPPTHTCETVNKQTNFVMFLELAVLKSPKEVSFLITWSGHQLLAVDEFYESIGMSPPKRRELVPIQSNVVSHQLARPAETDLCQRARALKSLIKYAHIYDYVLFLNDSCRGPFVSEHTNPLVASPTPWLEVYVQAMQKSKRIAAVGQMSCEIDFHVMSWGLMLTWDVYRHIVHRMYLDSCSDTKSEVIVQAEVGSIKAILENKHSVASLWPYIEEFSGGTQRQDKRLQRALRGCQNTFSPGHGPMDCWWWENMSPNLGNLAFVKYGGKQLRERKYATCYVDYVEKMTRKVLDIRGEPHKECEDKVTNGVQLVPPVTMKMWISDVLFKN